MNAGGGLDRLLGGLQSVLELAIASLEAEEHPVCGAALHSYSEAQARLSWVLDDLLLLDSDQSSQPDGMLGQPAAAGDLESSNAAAAAAATQAAQSLTLAGLQQDGSLALVREVCQGLQQSISARLADLSGVNHSSSAVTGHDLLPDSTAPQPQLMQQLQQQQQQRPSGGPTGSQASNATSLHAVNCGAQGAYPEPAAYPSEAAPTVARFNPFLPAAQPQLYAQSQFGLPSALPPGIMGFPHMLQGMGLAGMTAWGQGVAQLQFPGWAAQLPVAGNAWHGAVPTNAPPAHAAAAGVLPQHLVPAGQHGHGSSAGQHAHETNPGATGRTGGSPSAGGLSQEVQDVVQRCRKEVAGSLNDLAGLSSVKQELRQAVFLPLKFPHLFTGLRAPPTNFLFYGPPGTGKTMLVEKVAAEAGMTLLCLPPSAVLSKWSGESEKTLRATFQAAIALRPCAIFMDEIDSLAPSRGGGGGGGSGGGECDPTSRRLLTELLIQMNQISNLGSDASSSGSNSGSRSNSDSKARKGDSSGATNSAGSGGRDGPDDDVRASRDQAQPPQEKRRQGQVFIFAATNRIQDCDTALLRRFQRRIHVPLPDEEARVSYLKLALGRPEMAHTLDLDDCSPQGHRAQLLAASQGYSFSDLAAVMREAALAPVRELMTQFSDQDLYSSVCEALQPADTPLTAAGSSDEDAGRGVLPHMRPLQLSDFLAAFAKVAPAGQDADGG